MGASNPITGEGLRVDTVAVNCNSCGAPLEVGPGTNFVTCRHCGSRLALKRTATSSYTEVLENIDRKTDVIAARLEQLAKRDEIEQLDREWEHTRAKYLVTSEDGQREPNATAGLTGAVMATVFGVIWTGFALSMDAPLVFPLFGLVFIGVGIVSGLSEGEKAARYRDAKVHYRRRRAALTSETAAESTENPPG
jgi:hypothetical protein